MKGKKRSKVEKRRLKNKEKGRSWGENKDKEKDELVVHGEWEEPIKIREKEPTGREERRDRERTRKTRSRFSATQLTLVQVRSWCKKYDTNSLSSDPSSNDHAASAGSNTLYVLVTTSCEGSFRARSISSQHGLNFSSSSVKATITPRDRTMAWRTLSALSSVSICLSMDRTREPRSSGYKGVNLQQKMI